MIKLKGGMIASLITAPNAETRVITLAEKLFNKDNSIKIREWTEEDKATANWFLFLDAF